MKHLYYIAVASVCMLFCTSGIQAQTSGTSTAPKFYVCEGYDDDDYSMEKYSDIEFSSEGDSLFIGDDHYAVADIDSITFIKPYFPCVDIVWNGTSAKVTIDPSITGVTYKSDGGHVTITSTNTTDEILYVLSGSSSNGSFTLNGTYKLRMHLNGVSLTSSKGAAVDVECGKRVEVKLMKNTVNTFVDSSSGTQSAAFYVKGHLELKGKGTLNVTGKTKHGLRAGEYLQLKSSLGEVNILGAVNDGIHCGEGDKADPENSRFIMNGGTVTVSNCAKDCIDCDDYGTMFINGGSITVNVNQTDGNGVACDSIIYMNGGEITANVTGIASNGVRTNYDAYLKGGTIKCNVTSNGGVGFKAKRTTSSTATVRSGGYVHFQGTNLEMTVSGGIYSTDNSPCAGIWVDRELYQTDGDISITVNNTDAQSIYARKDNWDGTSGTRHIQ